MSRFEQNSPISLQAHEARIVGQSAVMANPLSCPKACPRKAKNSNRSSTSAAHPAIPHIALAAMQ